MTLEEAKAIAFREPILLNGEWIIDVYPHYENGHHILTFKETKQCLRKNGPQKSVKPSERK